MNNHSLSFITTVSDYSECCEYTGSCKFVKKVLPHAIATLLYNRCALNEYYIKKHSIHNVPYVALRSTIPKDHGLFPLLSAHSAVQQLIEGKYLKQVQLVIQPNQEGSEKEVYTFNLVYNSSENESADFDSGLLRAASIFFATINQLKAAKKYSEDEVTFTFYWAFVSNTPQELASKFEFVEPPKYMEPVQHISANFVTNYHHIQLSAQSQSNKKNAAKKDEAKSSENAKLKTDKIRNKGKRQLPKEEMLQPDSPEFKRVPSEIHSVETLILDPERAVNDAQSERQSSNAKALTGGTSNIIKKRGLLSLRRNVERPVSISSESDIDFDF